MVLNSVIKLTLHENKNCLQNKFVLSPEACLLPVSAIEIILVCWKIFLR